jgi:hypothetical protein
MATPTRAPERGRSRRSPGCSTPTQSASNPGFKDGNRAKEPPNGGDAGSGILLGSWSLHRPHPGAPGGFAGTLTRGSLRSPRATAAAPARRASQHTLRTTPFVPPLYMLHAAKRQAWTQFPLPHPASPSFHPISDAFRFWRGPSCQAQPRRLLSFYLAVSARRFGREQAIL